MRAQIDWEAGTERIEAGDVSLADVARIDNALHKGCIYLAKMDFNDNTRSLSNYVGFSIIEESFGDVTVVFEFSE